MKERVLELVSRQDSYNKKMNIMREYLQAYALNVMYSAGMFRSTAFLGGTALRFLYDIPRFSEDLDFSLVKKSEDYDFVAIIGKIKDAFASAGYDISVSYNDKNTVQNALFKFASLMYEVGVSPLKAQKFSIKVEVDTNPPEGGTLKTDIINKYFPISFLSYDLPSLFSGKLNAILCRKYVKGRDFFDLGWYLSKWKELSPNLGLLKNGLIQTKWNKDFPGEDNWREYICEAVKNTNWDKVKEDVQNFLENPSDLDVFSQENILNLLRYKKV